MLLLSEIAYCANQVTERGMDVTDSSRPVTEGSQTGARVAEVDAIAAVWDQAVPPGGRPAGSVAEVANG